MLKKILVALLFLFPATALAKINPSGLDAWTIYAFGNAQVLGGIVEAAKGMMGTGYFTTLIAFVAILTVIIASTMSVQGGLDGKKIGGMVLAVTAMATIGIKEKSDVYIHDPVFGDHVMVQDVPAVVALPAAFITTMGHRITEMLETHFTTPDSLSLSGGGAFNLSNSILAASTKLDIRSPHLKSSINKFTNDCLIPSVAMGWISSNEILTSTDLWGTNGTFSNVNPSLFTVVYSGNHKTGLVVPCREAGMPQGVVGETVSSVQFPSVNGKASFEYISNYLEAASVPWMAEQTRTIGKEEWLSNTINSAQKYIFGVSSYDTTKSLEQAAAVNAMRPIIQGLSAQLGQEASTMGFAVAQAEISQRNSWAMSAILFQDMAGYAYSVLQAFIIGLTPIMFVMMLLPGGLKVAKNYGAILLWLALWEPTLAIVNYVIQLYSIGSLGMLGGGYTMTNMALLDTRTSNFILAASALAAAVPMITWAIIKGGNAFTSYIAGGIGTQFANKAAETATSANRDYGNISTHNKTLDQEMMAMRTVAGNSGVTSNWGGSLQHRDFGGTSASLGGAALSQQVQAMAGQGYITASELSKTAQKTGSTAMSNLSGMVDNFSSSYGVDGAHGRSGSSGEGAGIGNSKNTQAAQAAAIEQLHSYLKAKGIEYGNEGSLGLTTPVGGVKNSVKVSESEGNQLARTAKAVLNHAATLDGQNRHETLDQLSTIFSNLSKETANVDQSASEQWQKMSQQAHIAAAAYKTSETATNTAQVMGSYTGQNFSSHAEAEKAKALINQELEMLKSRHNDLVNVRADGDSVSREVADNQQIIDGNVAPVEDKSGEVDTRIAKVKHDAAPGEGASGQVLELENQTQSSIDLIHNSTLPAIDQDPKAGLDGTPKEDLLSDDLKNKQRREQAGNSGTGGWTEH